MLHPLPHPLRSTIAIRLVVLLLLATLTASVGPGPEPAAVSPLEHLDLQRVGFSVPDDPTRLVLKIRPTPSPSASPSPAAVAPSLPPIPPRPRIISIIRRAARSEGIDPDAFLAVAVCESGLRPRALSPNGLYAGLFQHAVRYWPARARRAGYAGASVFDPVANAAVSARLWRVSGPHHWPTCARRAGAL